MSAVPFPTEACARIVRTRTGQQTGETIYETEDGRTWTDAWRPEPSGLTVPLYTRGYINQGTVCTHARRG